jgi:hypothetical protein
MENTAKANYIKYIKETYTKNTIVNVRKVAQYNFNGFIRIAVHHVTDDGTIVGYTCYGEYWELSYGDAFSRYIPGWM